MNAKPRKIIIVGAGIAGLTLAYRLSAEGRDVLLIEKEPEVGGLARSFSYSDYVFDIGPHRFHTDNLEVMDFVKEMLNNEFLAIERKSGVWMFGRYFDWPLRLSAISGIPFKVLLSAVRDMLFNKRRTGKSFEDYVISEYGETLYKLFFKPYTEKFLGKACSEISRDWAVTGIERAVIDKKIKVDNLLSVAKSVFSSKPPITFVYPKNGGIAKFAGNLMQRIEDKGGKVLLNTEVTEIVTKGNTVQEIFTGKTVYDCDLLVWTGSISALLGLLVNRQIELEYLSLLLFNYQVNHEPLNDFQWCYYGSADVPFNRVSTPLLFNPVLAPRGRTGICAEVTCRQDDRRWKDPLAIEPLMRKALVRTGSIRDESAVIGVNIEKIPNAYPIYTLDYKEKLSEVFKTTDEFLNLKLLGRTGTFWYNNMDHSIEAAQALHREIIGNETVC